MKQVWLACIPLFVAFDVLGLLPMYWTLARGLPRPERRQAVHRAVVVAFFVALAFLWVSAFLFRAMGIHMADVLIAGGVILFVLALGDLLRPEKTPYGGAEALGVVPLGVPLIVGPAVLTTMLLTRERFGLWATVGAVSVNILFVWMALQAADRAGTFLAGDRAGKILSGEGVSPRQGGATEGVPRAEKRAADRLMERIGREGAAIISKVFNLLLAAFAVMLVRHGLAAWASIQP